ncbi:hypothetical protein O0L34_g19338 [Tuta absoluta]|nr:hypothetical protein O0L34_g19338 [Tuta absoluta]
MSNANSTFLQETAEASAAAANNALEIVSPPQYVTFRNQMKNLNINEMSFETSVLKILQDMQDQQGAKLDALQAELVAIRAQNDAIHKKQTDLESSVKRLNENYQEVLDRLSKLEEKEKLNEATNKNQFEQDLMRLNELESQVEDMNRKIRMKSIEIANIPYQKDESLMSILQNVFTALNVDFGEDKISDVHRVPKKDIQKRTIIVELNNLKNKNDLMGALKNYNKQHRDSLFSTENLQMPGNKMPIYMSHYLTPAAARLFFLGRNLKKQRNYKYCWSSLGKIYIKKDDASPAILLKNEDHAHHLMTQ